MGLEIRTS